MAKSVNLAIVGVLAPLKRYVPNFLYESVLKLNSSACVIVTTLFLVTTGCNATGGKAYDSAQDNPKNHLPEQIVIFGDNDRSKPEENLVLSEELPGGQDYKNSAEYAAWLKAKEANNSEYQNFLEFRDWLEFQKLRQAN